MRVIVHGATGAMGRELLRLAEAHYEDSQLAAAVSPEGGAGITLTMGEVTAPADVILDFSFHTAIFDVVNYARAHKLPVVIGTTGHSAEEKQAIFDAAKEIPVFYTGNMSVGIAVLTKLAMQAAAAFPGADVEIVEIHHNRKVDAPSGTALMLAKAVQQARGTGEITSGRTGHGKRTAGEIGIQSVRRGNIVGIHEIHISTGTQTLTLTHEAHDRALFAEGAMTAAAWVVGQEPGLYNMDDLLKED